MKKFLLFSLISIISAVQPITFTYKKVGDLDLVLDVYVPETTIYTNYPVIFIIHGGGYLAGTTKYCSFSKKQLDEILHRGWVAVSIEYRLAPAVLLKEIVQDCHDAYTWVRTELIKHVQIDSDKIIVFGGSAGGGLAVISGYKFFPPPKAIISFYPLCTNFLDPYCYNSYAPINESIISQANKLKQNISAYIVENYHTDLRYIFFLDILYTGRIGWLLVTENFDDPPVKIEEKLKEFSAVFNMGKNYPPTYLVHSLNDSFVPYNQSVQMANRLKELKIEFKLDLVPDAEHGFDLEDISIEAWKEHILPVFEFAQKHISGKVQNRDIDL